MVLLLFFGEARTAASLMYHTYAGCSGYSRETLAGRVAQQTEVSASKSCGQTLPLLPLIHSFTPLRWKNQGRFETAQPFEAVRGLEKDPCMYVRITQTNHQNRQ